MRHISIAILVLGIAACTSPDELTADQGACSGLDQVACGLASTCQIALLYYGNNPAPTPMECLVVEGTPQSSQPCVGLSHDACRSRADCSPEFTESPSGGAATFRGCGPELEPSN